MAIRQAAAQTRERLIDAAVQTIHSIGAANLTLDAVAKEAGVSKGGLLHHFPSKDALIEAVLRYFFVEFQQSVQQQYESEKNRPGRWARAYIRATFAEDPLPLELNTMLFSIMGENSILMALIREDFAYWHVRLMNDGLSPARATIIRQAADSYWMERLLQIESENQPSRQSLLDELLSLVEL
ncbi:MAG: TetR family transcriptional regulator [Chitinophagaceae bacterium]|nr:TetR family transcriptional regulator [Anaerolineae bacterium]